MPLVEKVKREILSRLGSHDFVDDSGRLPSEEELSREFGVSRSTIRTALTWLEDSGVVTRRHGVGTYVNHLAIAPRSVWGWLDEFTPFEDLIRNSNHIAKTLLLETKFRPAGASASPLQVDPDAPVVWLSKVYHSDSSPILYSEVSIPLELIEPERRDLEAIREVSAQSVYQILETYFDVQVHRQVTDIRAEVAEPAIAGQLEYPVGRPLLCLEEVGYSVTQLPLYHGVHRFCADLVSFRLVRRPVLSINTIT